MARNSGIDRTFASNQDLLTLDDALKFRSITSEKRTFSNQEIIDTTQTTAMSTSKGKYCTDLAMPPCSIG